MNDNISFYDSRRHTSGYRHELDEDVASAEKHGGYLLLKKFIEEYKLENRKCLEIGSGRGMFQDLVTDYTGTDIAEVNEKFYHKPYFPVTEARYPFEDEQFDAIWTIHVFEHIPDLQNALNEIKRLLKPDGVLYFAPAWQCRSWAADGYAVRPYKDFGLRGKMIKALIPLRDSVFWRSLFLFPKRVCYHFLFILGKKFFKIRYRKIRPNWERYWTSDSDACNSIDPHDAILWFESNGFRCLSHSLHLRAFFVRTGTLIFRKVAS